jgi:nitric oxide dioxygenase
LRARYSATPEILEAWAAAYGQLAAIMIDREASLYSAVGSQEN